MSFKKILFIGDLRTAYNYGAIATSEALLDLIIKVADNAELKCIDHRSFYGRTPAAGYPHIAFDENIRIPKSSAKNTLAGVLKTIHLYNAAKLFKEKLQRNTLKDPNCVATLPYRFDQFKKYADLVKQGKNLPFEKSVIKWADVVIINAEGSIVNGTDKDGYYRFEGRYVLFTAYLSKIVFNKPTYIINHTVDPKNRNVLKMLQKIYPQLDGIYVREKLSLKYLKDIGITNGQYIPDALWSHNFEEDAFVKKPSSLADFNFTQKYVCLGDSSGIVSKYSHVKWNIKKVYSRLIEELKKYYDEVLFIDGYSMGNDEINSVIKKNHIRRVSLNDCNYHELYYVLKHAQLFISGRWHASIISLMAHTPILLWGSDSHKTEALYKEVDYPYEFFDIATLPINIDRVVDEAKRISLDNHVKIWDKVAEIESASFDNVKMLL